jgi:hypothetical protein
MFKLVSVLICAGGMLLAVTGAEAGGKGHGQGDVHSQGPNGEPPTWEGSNPPGFSEGEKSGWTDGSPPGWEDNEQKQGWDGSNPPGLQAPKPH